MTGEAARPLVIKIGGSTLGAHDTSLRDCARLHLDGRPLVLVHGGGAAVSEWLEKLEIPSEFVDGLRRTTADSLDVVVAVLAGLVNKRLVRDLAALGATAVGISGADGGIMRSPVDQRGLGLVGDKPVCDPTALRALLAAGLLPVVAPIGLSEEGGDLLNINADSAAGAIAAAFSAAALIFLTDVPGLLNAERQVIPDLSPEEAEALRARGVIDGGMLPKVAACQQATARGATAWIVDGRAAGAVPDALAGHGGTRVR